MQACANISWIFIEAGPTLAARCLAAKKAGFSVVESDWPQGNLPAETYRAALDEAGLQAILLNCYQGDTSAGECGFTAEPGHEDRYKESLDITLQYARTIGAKKIHLLSGRDLSSQGVTKAEQEKTLIKNLQESLPALQQANVIALIEPINSFSKPGYFLNNFETACRVISSVGSPLVKMQLDLFHLQMTEGNLVNNIKKFLPFTGHVQVAQAPHRHEPSMAGEVNYKYVLEQLYIAGYRGHIGCEYKPSVTSESSLGWIKEWGLHF